VTGLSQSCYHIREIGVSPTTCHIDFHRKNKVSSMIFSGRFFLRAGKRPAPKTYRHSWHNLQSSQNFTL
jgi:hypothetical protein